MLVSQRRPKIPIKIEQEVLYRSAYSCVICQKTNIQIHHIDKDNTNNAFDNLAPLCQEHHGEAHTKRELTLSLSSDRIKACKQSWEAEVERRRLRASSVREQCAAAGEYLGSGIAWGYINHARVSQLITKEVLSSIDARLLRECKERGLVDRNGIIIKGSHPISESSYLKGSIYDSFSFGDDHRVHRLYSEIVDAIAAKNRPIHIDDHSFTAKWVDSLLSPGMFVFINRGHYFRQFAVLGGNLVRKAYVKRRKVSFEYLIETKDMFGTSSMTVSFKGHQTAAALAMVKSVEHGAEIVVHCTPIALGVGFWGIGVLNQASSEP